jgi:hypothetical protein
MAAVAASTSSFLHPRSGMRVCPSTVVQLVDGDIVWLVIERLEWYHIGEHRVMMLIWVIPNYCSGIEHYTWRRCARYVVV